MILILAGAGAATPALLALDRSPASAGSQRYVVELDTAFGLSEGADLRVGGVRAGTIKTIKLDARPPRPPKAAVAVEVTEPGIDLRRDATCGLRPQSLIGEYYIDCQPGSSRRQLPVGGRLPASQTESSIPLDLVLDVNRGPVRERLRILLTSLGMGMAGRPGDLQEVLRRLHPGLRETSRVLDILGDQQRVIDAFIRDADTTLTELETNKRDVVRFVREAGETAELAAARREDLQAMVERLPGFLRELRPTTVRAQELADRGVPLFDGLRRAAPDMQGLLASLGPFATQMRPALRALGGAAEPVSQALRAGRAEARELRRLAREAPGLAEPLRQFLDSMDDRRRAVVNDPLAPDASPPAPDPTHAEGTVGFTGFENLGNWLYWQVWDINGFDRFGHLLRATEQVDQECSPYANRSYEGNEDFYRRCNYWLGPNQPGLTTPDPSEPNEASARARQRAGRPADRIGERRGPGEPRAGALPGQRDISKPHVVVPPLLRDLRAPELRGRPRTGGRGDTPTDAGDVLLDFLLAP